MFEECNGVCPSCLINNSEIQERLTHLEQQVTSLRQQLETLRAERDRLHARLSSATGHPISTRDSKTTSPPELPLLQALLEHAPLAMSVTDLEGRYLIVNRYICERLQRPAADILGFHFDTFLPPDIVAQIQADRAHIQATGTTVTREYTIPLPDGPHVFFQTLFPITDATNTQVAFGSIALDITDRKQAEVELHKFQQIVEQSPSSVMITDAKARIEYVNPRFTEMTGYSLEDVRGQNPHLLQSGMTPQATYQTLWKTIRSGKPWYGELLNRRKDGSLFWEWAAIAPILDAHGSITHFVGIKEDITLRKQMEANIHQLNADLERRVQERTAALEEANAQLAQSLAQLEATHTALAHSNTRNRALLDALPDSMFLCTYDGTVLDVHLGTAFPFHLRVDRIIGQNWHHAMPADFATRCDQAVAALQTSGTLQIFEWQTQERIFEIRLTVCGPDHVLAVVRNITTRKHNEQRLHQLAFYDSLTGLLNRVGFTERLEQVRQQVDTHFAILLLDIDRFKTINDSLGHLFGDQVLVAIAQRLQACLPPQALLARLGGDEFAILLDHVSDDTLVIDVAEAVQQACAAPFTVGAAETFVTVSIGIALSSISAQPSVDPLRDADTALAQAKADGRRCTVVFDTAMHLRIATQMMLEIELRRAFERQELHIYYQPIINLASGELHGFEALVRWQHPQRGLLSPGTFLTIAEEMGLNIAIDRWMLRAACRQLQEWQTRHVTPHLLTMSVNLSPLYLMHSDLLGTIEQILNETGVAPQQLNLEITEGSFIQYPDTALTLVEQLRKLGVQISLDDFGTGYSSLSYLQKFPLTTLKIDRSFVQQMDTQPQDWVIVQALVMLAHTLGMTVVAEGAETEVHLAHLQTLQCDYVQGYVFAEPLDAVAAEAFIGSWQAQAKQAVPDRSHSVTYPAHQSNRHAREHTYTPNGFRRPLPISGTHQIEGYHQYRQCAHQPDPRFDCQGSHSGE